MGNEGDTHVRERSHLQGPQLLAHPSSLPSSPCLWPFLFNTIAPAASLSTHCLSLSIYLSICLSFTFPMHIIWMCDPAKWICPHIKDLFFYFKSKRDMQLIVRNSFCHPSNPLPLALVAGACRATVMHFHLLWGTYCIKLKVTSNSHFPKKWTENIGFNQLFICWTNNH